MSNLQGPESDLWSLGILLYELHIGKEPFAGKSSSDMLHLISNQAIKFSSKFFSREAMKLVKSLLKFKPNRRISIQQLMDSPFIKKNCKQKQNGLNRARTDSNAEEMHFDPPQKVFISQYERAPFARKSRPKTKNKKNQKNQLIMRESQNSLYQPQIQSGKKIRRVSRVKRPPQESVIRPKIYLKKTKSNNQEGLWNDVGLAQFRNGEIRSKTLSEHSLGFLSKEDNMTTSREIQIVPGLRQNMLNRENNAKGTVTTGNEFKRPEDHKQSETWMNLSGSLVPKRNTSFLDGASREMQSNEDLSGSIRNWRKRSRSKQLSCSNEKHFIRSTNSELKFPKGKAPTQMNSDQNQVNPENPLTKKKQTFNEYDDNNLYLSQIKNVQLAFGAEIKNNRLTKSLVNYLRFKQDPYQRNPQFLQESNSKISFQSSTGQNLSQDKFGSDSKPRVDEWGSFSGDLQKTKTSLKNMKTCPEFSDVKSQNQLTQSLMKLSPKRGLHRLTLEHKTNPAPLRIPRKLSQIRRPEEREFGGQKRELLGDKMEPKLDFEFIEHVKSIPNLTEKKKKCEKHVQENPEITTIEFSREMANKFKGKQQFQKPPTNSKTKAIGQNKPQIRQNTSTFEYSYGTKNEAPAKRRRINHRVRIISKGVAKNFREVVSKESAQGTSKSPLIYRPKRGLSEVKSNWRLSGQSRTTANLHGTSSRLKNSRNSTLKRNFSTEYTLRNSPKRSKIAVDLNPYEYYDISKSGQSSGKKRVTRRPIARKQTRHEKQSKLAWKMPIKKQLTHVISRGDVERKREIFGVKRSSEYYA